MKFIFDFNFPDISTSEAPFSLPASIASTSSVDSSIVNNVPSSSESTISSTTSFPLISTTTESDSSGIVTTVVTTEDIAETSTPSTKTTTIDGQRVENDQTKIETVTSSTINAETTTSHNEEISHREHGRALNLTNVVSAVPAKAKAFNDLSDVSMDDDTFGDGNDAKEEMVIAQTQHKECESKVRK